MAVKPRGLLSTVGAAAVLLLVWPEGRVSGAGLLLCVAAVPGWPTAALAAMPGWPAAAALLLLLPGWTEPCGFWALPLLPLPAAAATAAARLLPEKKLLAAVLPAKLLPGVAGMVTECAGVMAGAPAEASPALTADALMLMLRMERRAR